MKKKILLASIIILLISFPVLAIEDDTYDDCDHIAHTVIAPIFAFITMLCIIIIIILGLRYLIVKKLNKKLFKIVFFILILSLIAFLCANFYIACLRPAT